MLIVGSLWADAKFVLRTHRSDSELRHRALHFVVFAATALWFLFLTKAGRRQWFALAGLICLGAGLELIQSFTYGNIFEWWDLRDDLYGVVLGFVLFQLYVMWRAKYK